MDRELAEHTIPPSDKENLPMDRGGNGDYLNLEKENIAKEKRLGLNNNDDNSRVNNDKENQENMKMNTNRDTYRLGDEESNNNEREKDSKDKTRATLKEKKNEKGDYNMLESVRDNSQRNSSNISLAEAIGSSIKDSLGKSLEEVELYTSKRMEEVTSHERDHNYKMTVYESELNQLQTALSTADLREKEYENKKVSHAKEITKLQEEIDQMKEYENTHLPQEGETLEQQKKDLVQEIDKKMAILTELKKQRDEIITEFTMGIQAYKHLGLEICSIKGGEGVERDGGKEGASKQPPYLSIKFTQLDKEDPSRPFVIGLRVDTNSNNVDGDGDKGGERSRGLYRLITCSPVLPENKAELLLEILNQQNNSSEQGCGDFQPFSFFLKAIRREFKALV